MPAVGEHLTAKYYVDNAIFYRVNESSILRLDPYEKLELDKQGSIIVNSTSTSPKTIIELLTKSCVDSLHKLSRNRRDLRTVFNDQDDEFDNDNLTNLDSITVIRNPILDTSYQIKNMLMI